MKNKSESLDLKESNSKGRVPKLRFPEFLDAREWEEKLLSTLLDYERPDKYIVADTNYQQGGTPVLTANKSFILGYTNEKQGVFNDIPVIIFDDFTTDKKYVDFPFKVKSSAIKILKNNGNNSLKVIFELMNQINFEAKEHKRYYISEYQNLTINIPKLDEQQKIAGCLSSLDELITAQTQKLARLKTHKIGLMQQLFPAEGETMPKLRFPEFRDEPVWEEKEVGEVFRITRGEVLSMTLVKDTWTKETPYPVYSSQTKNNGLAGYYSDYLYENAITWTTDGANAGDVNYRPGKFYCTNVCGVLIETEGHANACVAAIINSISKSHVSYVGNPKLMNGVMSKIRIPFPSIPEQQKIAACLCSLDELISAQTQKLARLKTHKIGLMQQLFPSADEVS